MYKRKGKFLQRMKEHGWKVGKLGVPVRTQKRKASKAGSNKTGKRKVRVTLPCPVCGAAIPRTVKLIWLHFLQEHQQRLTEPEAFRMASRQRVTPNSVPDEELKRDLREVSGGLPSLGKRR